MIKRNNALVVAKYSLGNSPSLLNLVEFLAGNGGVVLFLESVAHVNLSSIVGKSQVTICYFDDRLSIKHLYSLVTARLRRFKRIVTVDPHGFSLSRHLFPGCRPYYYSLELYLKDDHYGLDYPLPLQIEERSNINTVRGLIIQSEEKERLFRADYALAETVPSYILPVTYMGSAISGKSDCLHRIFNIPPMRKIALHLGSISELFACKELAESFAGIDDWALVFHGYPKAGYIDELRGLIRNKAIDNVYIHDRQFDSLHEVDKVIRAADVGVAWYENLSAGFRTAGLSSGKIPAYLKCGLPVIANVYPSTRRALEDPGCGVCVVSHQEIPLALRSIADRYEVFSAAAHTEYERRYRFENYSDSLRAFLGIGTTMSEGS